MTARTLVAIATYNEIENLPRLVEEVLRHVPQGDVLVVDDNSPDGTGRWCAERAAREPRLHVIHRPGKLGLGTAVVEAIHYAAQHDYQLLVTMDADFSHSPAAIPESDPLRGRGWVAAHRRGDRLPICWRRPHPRLALAAPLDEPDGQCVRTLLARIVAARLQRRIPLLSCSGAATHRLVADALPRVLLSGGIAVVAGGPGSRHPGDADRVCRSPPRQIQDRPPRSLVRTLDPVSIGNGPIPAKTRRRKLAFFILELETIG